jgi:hypothetical protein
MTYSLLGLSFRNIAMMALAVAATAASACSGNMGSETSGASSLSGRAMKVAPTYSWSSFVTVSPSPPAEVTGINNLDPPEIVGFYTVTTTGTKSSPSHSVYYSFTSNGSTFTNITYASYPRVHGGSKQTIPPMGTQMNAIATQPEPQQTPVLAGWVNQPGDQGGTWPVVDYQGFWSLENNGTGAAAGKNGQTAELFGINDSGVAVGCVTNAPAPALTACSTSDTSYKPQANYFSQSGNPQAFQKALQEGLGTTVSRSAAYGIDDAGDMVGVATLSTGTNESWYALCMKNCPTSSPPYTCMSTSGTNTFCRTTSYCIKELTNGTYTPTMTAYAISISKTVSGGYNTRLVAGSYTEGSGTTKVTYGFLAQVKLNTSTSVCEQVGTPQMMIEVNNSTLTVVRGINNDGYIVGYYMNKKGKQDGFVGIPATSPKRRR